MGHYGHGLHPDIFDPEEEGLINSYRAWTFAGGSYPDHEACVLGITQDGKDGLPYTGQICPTSGYINATFPLFPSGTLTINPTQASYYFFYAKNQLSQVKYVAGAINNFGETLFVNSSYTYNNIDKWLSAYPNLARTDDGEQCPDEIVKMGVYSHFLGDRVSHYYCTDSQGTNMVQVGSNPDRYQVTQNFQNCNFR